MNINFNLNKLICNCNKTLNEDVNIEKNVEIFNKITELNQGLATFEILLGKLILLLDGDYGYINKAETDENDLIVFRPLAMCGISVNDKIFLYNFFNVPLFYLGKYVGTLGYGGKNIKLTQKYNVLEDIIARELYKLT